MTNSSSVEYDTIIIGGGPSGLSAATYTAREKMKTLVLDKSSFGGMAAITETIDNYPGFSKGVGGLELTNEMLAQAERFGALCTPFADVVSIESNADRCIVKTTDETYYSKTVLVCSGSTYRKLNVPGEEDLIGKGLHFCATCDAPLYKDRNVVVVGGGNSALQESLFIARFAASVHMLVRGHEFTGSEVLVDAVNNESKISVQYDAAITALQRPQTPGEINITINSEGDTTLIKADGIFVFIGLLPNNHPFEECGLDERGFIISDQEFKTKMPRVFVAGDIRSGSTWQIGSAVGEGVSAALSMRKFLDEEHPDWHRS